MDHVREPGDDGRRDADDAGPANHAACAIGGRRGLRSSHAKASSHLKSEARSLKPEVNLAPAADVHGRAGEREEHDERRGARAT